MSTYDLIGKSLRNFLYITEGKGGFLFTLPGRTDVIGRVVTFPKDEKDQPLKRLISTYIDDVNIKIELFLIEETENRIYLTPSPDSVHRCLLENLLNCRGSLNIFNHRGKDIYFKLDRRLTFTAPVIVRINRAISPLTTPQDTHSVKNILQIKSNNFSVDYHYGRECFQIYFSYNPVIIEYIKQKTTERHYAFNFDDSCWKIDRSCASEVLNLLDFIDQSGDSARNNDKQVQRSGH